MRPFVDIPDMSDIGVGESVCVRVIVPLRPSNSTDAFVPLPSAPWDSILLDMVGLSSGISIPVNLQPVSDMRNRRQDSVHIYEANVVLRDIDVYHPEGFLEFRDARWNPEGPLLPQQYSPEPLDITEAQQVVVKDEHRASPYSLWKYTELPLCTDSNAEGRWVYVHNIPFDPELVPLPDNLNRVWLPYTCRLRRVSYAQFAQCLVSKYPRVHWYGDSNVRRSLKKISSLGEWCSTKEDQESAVCTCEDYRSDFTRFSIHARNTFFDIDAVDGGLSLANETDFARVPENKARMAVFKIEGLTARNVSPWIDRFANGTVKMFGNPQAVIISLVNWDAAFTSLEFFASQVALLIGRLNETYLPNTRIILRTGQYHCCYSDQSATGRKYSQLRNRYFNDMHIGMIKEALGDLYDVRVWDVASVAQRRPLVGRQESQACYSNHVRSEVVEVENQILFNSLCN
ncbi:hypothetical protein GGF37_002453 [Kickxella alabastrina]|nr:hypothetical protein GGF37_002453 [Kickxella alabastrina]